MELSYGKFLQLVLKKTIVFAIDCKTVRIFAHVKNSKGRSKHLENTPKIGFAGKKDDGIRTTATRRRLFWSLFLICYISF